MKNCVTRNECERMTPCTHSKLRHGALDCFHNNNLGLRTVGFDGNDT